MKDLYNLELKKEVSDFVFNQAKEKMVELIANKDSLDKKSFGIITIMLSIMGIMVAFNADSIASGKLFASHLVLAIGFIFSFFTLLYSVFTKKYYSAHQKPSDILKADMEYLKDIKTAQNAFLIKWYDDFIDHTLEANAKQGLCINIAVILAFLSVATFILLAIFC